MLIKSANHQNRNHFTLAGGSVETFFGEISNGLFIALPLNQWGRWRRLFAIRDDKIQKYIMLRITRTQCEYKSKDAVEQYACGTSSGSSTRLMCLCHREVTFLESVLMYNNYLYQWLSNQPLWKIVPSHWS